MRILTWWKQLNRDYAGISAFGYGNWQDRLIATLIYAANVGVPLLAIMVVAYLVAG